MNIAQDHPKICDEIRELSSGCNGAARLAQTYEMGTILRYGNTEPKQRHRQGIDAEKTCLQAVSDMLALPKHGGMKRMRAKTPAAQVPYRPSAASFRGAPRTCGSVRRLDISNSSQTTRHKRDG